MVKKASQELSVEALLSSETPSDLLAKVRFEEGMALLQQLVSQVESGAIGLDDAVKSYEAGAGLLKHLRGLLSEAEAKVRVLQLDGNTL
jgi:exodeoxyribonuclease VII small subunit